ncbi:arylamine N-acetyltransferase family protein [Halomonas litopenaei]|uniref:arylamine N-acetyltransferase family protein n=1 Tax=Halomonas litopenaei TaxID=2109328 RepID=UPI003F9EE6A3
MPPLDFPCDKYRERIGLARPAETSADFLSALHRAQLTSLPFENFDICLGRGVDVSAQGIVAKLIDQRRGGYCFELNGLLLMALKAFGFEARALLGRVHLSGTPTGRSHQVSLVTLDRRQWLVDAGFGANTPRAPIPLTLDTPLHAGDQTLRLVEDARFGIMLQSLMGAQWVDLYSVDFTTVCDGDIQMANHFTSTWPGLHFTTSRMATLATPEGQITLSDFTLKIRRGDTTSEQLLPSGSPYLAALEEHFGIVLEAHYEDLAPLDP